MIRKHMFGADYLETFMIDYSTFLYFIHFKHFRTNCIK